MTIKELKDLLNKTRNALNPPFNQVVLNVNADMELACFDHLEKEGFSLSYISNLTNGELITKATGINVVTYTYIEDNELVTIFDQIVVTK